jgi:hypothetical protein
VKRGAKFAPDEASRASQDHHLTRLKAVDFYPAKPFTSADNLVARVFGSAVLDALKKAGSITKPRNLPFASLGSLLAGREEDLADFHAALLGAKGAPVALYGLGGIGKTRPAIEYAWSREADYSALLFVNASDGSALNTGLAALTAFELLDLPEKEARDDATKITAVLRWLESNPNWLMILDNVDDRAAVAEVAKLMPRLKGGHVVITARASNFPAFVRKLEVSTLDENAAAQFLLDRTDADRSKSKDDTVLARTRRPCAGVGTGRRAYRDRSHRLRALFEALERESRESTRLGECDGDGFRSDAGHNLGDLGRAALAGEPAAARPPRVRCPGPGSRFAPRRRSRRGVEC